MTDYVLTGLVKRRAEVAGQIETAHTALSKLVLDLENLDATIRQFAPDFQVETIKPRAFRPPKDWAHRNEMSRTVLSILRQAREPMTTRDLALELLMTRALDRGDGKLVRLMVRRVGAALRAQRENGAVRTVDCAGQMSLWEVAR